MGREAQHDREGVSGGKWRQVERVDRYVDGRRKDRRKSPEGKSLAHLFTCSHDFLQVIFRGESLHRC